MRFDTLRLNAVQGRLVEVHKALSEIVVST